MVVLHSFFQEKGMIFLKDFSALLEINGVCFFLFIQIL